MSLPSPIKRRQLNSNSKWVQLLAFSTWLLAAAGCGNKQQATQPSAPQSNAESAANAAGAETPVVRPIVVPDNLAGDTTPILNALTQALRKYAFEHHGMPRTFAEVVAAGYVSNLPNPPAGKKYEIDSKATRVVIVKQ